MQFTKSSGICYIDLLKFSPKTEKHFSGPCIPVRHTVDGPCPSVRTWGNYSVRGLWCYIPLCAKSQEQKPSDYVTSQHEEKCKSSQNVKNNWGHTSLKADTRSAGLSMGREGQQEQLLCSLFSSCKPGVHCSPRCARLCLARLCATLYFW